MSSQEAHCPICSKKMALEIGMYICPMGHYKILETSFDNLWGEFVKLGVDIIYSDAGKIESERLLQDLINNNLNLAR